MARMKSATYPLMGKGEKRPDYRSPDTPPHNSFPDDPPEVREKAAYHVGETPLDSVLRAIPSIEEQIQKRGANYDPNVGDRLLTLKMRIVIERAIGSPDIPLERRVDWALRGIGLFEGSKSTLWLKDEKPETRDTQAIQREAMERSKRIAEILKMYPDLRKGEAERIDVTVAPTVNGTNEA